MGNSPGDVWDYWQEIYKYPRLIGGCIWEWADHAVLKKMKTAKILRLRRRFDEETHDGNFCADGLVFPDRSFSTGALEVKAVYQPIKIEAVDLKAGKIKITNLYDFTNLNNFTLKWSIYCDGAAIQNGSLVSTCRHTTQSSCSLIIIFRQIASWAVILIFINQ